MRKTLMGAVFALSMVQPLWAAPLCKGGIEVSFTQRVETVAAQDEMVATLTATRQAETLLALNRSLNRLTRELDAAAQKLPEDVRLVLANWHTWPVQDAKRKTVLHWRGQLSYRLTGPLKGDAASRALQVMQRYMAVNGLQFRISKARRTALRTRLEHRLVQQARERLRQLEQDFDARSARFVRVRLESQAQPVPVRMMMKAMTVDMALPKLRAGEQTVAVSGQFVGCLTP